MFVLIQLIFVGFKDFTMNTGKLGLSFGEKFAFWMYGKVSQYSKSNFTHILLLAIIILYCALGGFLLYWVEAEPRNKQIQQNRNADYKIGNETYNVSRVDFSYFLNLNQIE